MQSDQLWFKINKFAAIVNIRIGFIAFCYGLFFIIPDLMGSDFTNNHFFICTAPLILASFIGFIIPVIYSFRIKD